MLGDLIVFGFIQIVESLLPRKARLCGIILTDYTYCLLNGKLVILFILGYFSVAHIDNTGNRDDDQWHSL